MWARRGKQRAQLGAPGRDCTNIEFEVELGHFEDMEDDEISAKVSSVNGKRMAKIKLKLESMCPPEGIARIRQELTKILPS